MKRWVAGGVLAAALAGAAWWGIEHRRSTPGAVATVDLPTGDREAEGATEVVTVDTPSQPNADAGATPMRDRVAVIGLLNKRNGVSRDLTMKPGQAIRVGEAVVRLRACERTAPWEAEPLTGAFVQLDVFGADKVWRRVHSGWLYKERPALNVVQHPVYDAYVKSCAMSFPETGPDTTVVSGEGGEGEASAATRSSRKKSPAAAGEAPAPTTPASAPDSNAT